LPSNGIIYQVAGSLVDGALPEGFAGGLISWRGRGSYQMADGIFAKTPKAVWN